MPNAGRGQHPHPVLPCSRCDRRELGGFPDPGLTLDNEGTARPAAEAANQVIQDAQFAVTPVQATRRGVANRDVYQARSPRVSPALMYGPLHAPVAVSTAIGRPCDGEPVSGLVIR